ncbi:MAG: CHAT domain-containing tetratricopeptide repeat protein, partial [Bacteroidota bacterium]
YLQAYAAALSLFGDERLSLRMIDTLSAAAEREGDYQGYFFLQSHRYSLFGRLGTQRNEIDVARDMSSIAARFGFYKWEAWAYQQIADLKYLEGDFTSSKTFSDRAAHAGSLAQETALWVYSLYRSFGASLELGSWLDAIENGIGRVEWAEQKGEERAYLYGLVDIGRAFQEIGLSVIAVDYFTTALSLATTLENDIAFVVSARFGLASALKSLGRVNQAEDNLRSCWSLVSGKRVWSLAEPTIVGGLAECMLMSGRLGDAVRLLRLQNRMLQSNSHFGLKIGALLDFGQFHFHLGKYDAALEMYLQAQSLSESLHVYAATTRALRGIARCHLSLGRFSEALASFRRLFEFHTAHPTTTSDCISPFAYNAELREDLEQYSRILVCNNNLDLALKVAETLKLAELLDPFSLPLASTQSRGSDSLYAELAELRVRLSELYKKMPSSLEKKLFEEGFPNSIKFRNTLISCEVEFRRALSKLAARKQLESVFIFSNPASTPDLHLRLKAAGSAVLEYMVGRDDFLVFVVTGDTICTFTRQVGEDSLVSLLSRLTPLLDPKQERESIWNRVTAEYDEGVSAELFRLLLGPALPLLGKVKTLTIVPDGVLRNLPFETLRSDKSGSGQDSVICGIQYLLERYSIKYEMAASHLLFEDAVRGKDEFALILGNEDGVYDYSRSDEAYWSNGNLEFDAFRTPGAIVESEVIERICYQNSPRESVTKTNKSAFVERSSRYRILHLASHAFWDDRYPANSYLNIGENANLRVDQSLRACEISLLDLEPELLVLSGCNTARWSQKAKSYGLLKPFTLKPHIAFVGSLWPVDDESTKMLMERFYTHLKKGMTTAEALRQAKLDLIHAGKSDPFYWGGFVLVGKDTHIDFTDHSSASGVAPGFLVAGGMCVWVFVLITMARPRHGDTANMVTFTRDIDGWIHAWALDKRSQVGLDGVITRREGRYAWVRPIS